MALDFRTHILHGELFRPPDDADRVEAFIPSMGHENHAANLVQLPNGDLLCAWFAGSAEGASDVRIALSRLPAGGERWSPPAFVSEGDGTSEQNPVLFAAPSGEVWLLYTAQQTRGCSREEWARRVAAGEAEGGFTMQWTAVIRRRVSRDGGQSWGPVEVWHGTPGSFCRQPLRVLSNGDWLFPMYYSLPGPGHGDDHSLVRISQDGGTSWTEHPVPGSRGRVQMCVVELGEGRLLATFRSRAADRVYLSRSSDYGRTWTAPERTVLSNNNASIQAARLGSGAIALAYNDYSANEDPEATVWPRRRHPLSLALSEDEGRTWPYRRVIDPSDGFVGEGHAGLNRRCDYPSLLETADGALHVAYSYRDRQCIKYVRVSERWVREGRAPLYPPG